MADKFGQVTLIASICSIVAACQETEVVDWIEVPLSANTFYDSTTTYKEETYDILILRQAALEFKLALNKGDSIAYNWAVDMAQPELLNVEFHGHTHRAGEEPGTVMFYKVHNDGKEQGALVAPFDGIHGWYLDNKSDEDITVKLRVAGFFHDVE